MNPIRILIRLIVWRSRLKQSPYFDSAYYLRFNPDVRNSSIDPINHFIINGASELRNPCPLIDAKKFAASLPEDCSDHALSLLRYISGPEEPHTFFPVGEGDPITAFSRELAQGAIIPRGSPCRGRSLFCDQDYLNAHPDVGSAFEGSPLEHYIKCGRFEGRYSGLSELFLHHADRHGEEFFDAILAGGDDLMRFASEHATETNLAAFLYSAIGYAGFDFNAALTVYFDVFDTLVFRTVANPHDLFYLMERDFSEPGWAEARIEAEEVCKRKFKKAQYLLQDIYTEIDRIKPHSTISIADELTWEKRAIKVRTGLLECAQELRRSGLDVRLLSDFYLRRDELIEILPAEIFEVFEEEDLLSSGDISFTKASGELYKYLAQSAERPPEPRRIIIGDNYHSDKTMIEKTGFGRGYVVPTVNRLISRDLGELIEQFAPETGQWLKASVLKSPGTNLLAPVAALCCASTAAFCDHVSKLVGAETVLMLERDAHMVQRAAEVLRLTPTFTSVPSSRPLNYAILGSFDKQNMLDAISRDGEMHTIADVGARFGYGFSKDLAETPVSYILNGNGIILDSLSDELLEHCKQQAANFKALVESKISASGPILCYDIGYRGTSARAFANLFDDRAVNFVFLATHSEIRSDTAKYESGIPHVETNDAYTSLCVVEAIMSQHNLGSALTLDAAGKVRSRGPSNRMLGEAVQPLQQEIETLFSGLSELDPRSLALDWQLATRVFFHIVPRCEFDFARRLIGVPDQDTFQASPLPFIDDSLDPARSSWAAGALRIADLVAQPLPNA